MKFIYKYILIGLEKFDKKETVAKRSGYRILMYLYPRVYKLAYGISPYSLQAKDEYDMYVDNLEYQIRMSEDGDNHA